MHRDVFLIGDSVLLVGEGNFSFAVGLVDLNLPITITASCLGSDILLKSRAENITYLKQKGKYCMRWPHSNNRPIQYCFHSLSYILLLSAIYQ